MLFLYKQFNQFQMKTIFKTFVLFLFSTYSVFAQIPVGYYNSANGLTGTQLQQALHDIIDNHVEQSYDALKTHFYVTDAKPNGKVWDMYSDIPNGIPPYEFTFTTASCSGYNSENDCYNREHSWPKSWFSDMSPMYSDLFHLYPTDGYVNGKRGNYPFGEVDGVASWTSMNGSKLGTCTYPGYAGTVFEPIDDFKGDFARTYFYMSTRYYNEDAGWAGSPMTNGSQLEPWALAMMLEWTVQDPVSQKEIDRNNAVYGIQQNRNPFIDIPTFAFDIWVPNGTLTVSLNSTENISCSQSVTLNPTIVYSDESLLTFQWSPVEGLSNPNIKNPIANPSSTTTYTLTVTCPNLCQSVNSTTVNVLNNSSFNTDFAVVTDTILDKPYTALFYNNTPNLSNYTFEWDFGDNTIVTNNGSAVAHEYVNSGNYSVKLKAINNTNCEEIVLKENCVHVLDGFLEVTLNASESIACGSSVVLNPTISYFDINSLTYQWSPVEGLSNPNIKNPTASPKSTTTYTLTVSCPSNCQSVNSTTVNIQEYVPFNVNFMVVTDSIVNSPFTALFYNYTPNFSNYSFVWDFGDSTTAINNNYAVIHEYSTYGDFSVKLTAKNNSNCEEIILKQSCVHVLNLSGITENSSNSTFEVYPNPASDNLTIKNNSKSRINIEILNSIGQKVYELETENSYEKIDVSRLENNSLYFISIRNKKLNTIEVKKLIIQKN